MSDLEAVKTEETPEVETVSSPEVAPTDAPLIEADPADEAAATSAEPAPTSTEADDEEVTIDTLKIGQHMEGTVKNITGFGAFVDVGIPQDGLVHISKLAKWKVDKVEDVVSIGQKVDVWVKKVDKKRGRLSLTMIKPVSLRLRDIEEDATLEGIVTRLEPYGAFIDIGSEREGLVHISQISHDYIKHPEETLAVDDKVTVQVLKVDRKKRQVDLSIKALLAPPEPEVVEPVREVAPPAEKSSKNEAGEEAPPMTAMAVAYTALQGKQQSDEADDSESDQEQNRPSEMDDIVSRTLASRK